MEGIRSVYFEDTTVGNCRITREGLYYRIACRCSRVTEAVCRLVLQCKDQNIDLGVLVPVDGGFGLDKRIPVKQLPLGQPHFLINVPGRREEPRFVPVREGEPFSYLSNMKGARFARRNGEAGVVLKA